MRVFLCLISLAALALGKPQYNYGSGVSGSFGSSTGALGGIDIRGNFGGNAAKLAGANTGSSFANAPAFGANNFQSSYGNNFNQFAQSGSVEGGHFEAPLVHKQFISVSAPEDHEHLERTKHLVIGRPQTNYRVVFIKAPSSSNANVKLSAEYAPKEEKTVIYVLAKNDNNLEVSDIATPAPTVPSKPEVFFIKYKTEEEAQHAQSQIQAEYDKIEGSSEHTDAGIAPQQSVVGILGNDNAGASFTGSSFSGASGSFGSNGLVSAPKTSAYLPPSVKK